MKDPDTSEKVIIAHEIQNRFRYKSGGEWVNDKEFRNKNRTYTQVFNELISRGFIERKKTHFGYKYRWKAHHPM